MSYTGPNYNAIANPQQWAELQLASMGLPVTASNTEFLVSWAAMEGGNWHNTAAFNPLNTTLQVAGSHVMGGGNVAGVQAYSNWATGIDATAQTLQGYPDIVAALRAGNAMSVNQSGGLGNNLSKWSGGGYTEIGSNISYANTTGGPTSTGAGTGGGTVGTAAAPAQGAPTGQGGQPLSMNDIPAVIAYIRQNYGTDAWLLDIPSVASVLEQAVVKGDSEAQVQAAIQQTEWWKTTSQAVKNYEQNAANNPADYGPQAFTNPGSVASQTLTQVEQAASTAGVQLNLQTSQTIAENALRYGWTAPQIQQAIAAQISVSPQGQTNAGADVNTLKQMAANYFVNPSDQVLQSWAQNLAAGTQTIQQFQALMQQQASTKWTGFASQLGQGYNMTQLTDNLRNDAAKTMEVDPSQIDFINNPVYSKILDYVPPDSPNGVHRVMTDSEMQQYLKSQPAYGFTQGARDSAAQLESTIASTWGHIAS